MALQGRRTLLGAFPRLGEFLKPQTSGQLYYGFHHRPQTSRLGGHPRQYYIIKHRDTYLPFHPLNKKPAKLGRAGRSRDVLKRLWLQPENPGPTCLSQDVSFELHTRPFRSLKTYSQTLHACHICLH